MPSPPRIETCRQFSYIPSGWKRSLDYYYYFFSVCAFSFVSCVSFSSPPAFHSNQHQRLSSLIISEARSVIFLSPPAYTGAVVGLIFFGIYCEISILKIIRG